MAFSTVPTSATGDLWSAANQNTYLKDNFSAVWVGTTAGDLDYYTSATTKNRLALTTGGILTGGASAPQYLALTAGGVVVGGASAPQYVSGTSGQVLFSNGTSAASFAGLIYRRQGGNASNWATAGTTTYTPTNPVIQVGVKNVSVAPGGSTLSITYPVAFTNRPTIQVTPSASSGSLSIRITNDSTTGFDVFVVEIAGGSPSTDVNWMAIGI